MTASEAPLAGVRVDRRVMRVAQVNCDLRCRKATVDAEQVRNLATLAKRKPKVWLLLNIGYGLFMQEDGDV